MSFQSTFFSAKKTKIVSNSIKLSDYVDVLGQDEDIIKCYHLSPNTQFIGAIMQNTESQIEICVIIIHDIFKQIDVYQGEWVDGEFDDINCGFTQDSQYFLSEAKYDVILINIETKKKTLFDKEKYGEFLCYDQTNLYFHKSDYLVICSFDKKIKISIDFNPLFKTIRCLNKTQIIFHNRPRGQFAIFDWKREKVNILWESLDDINFTYDQFNQFFIIEQNQKSITLKCIGLKKIIRNVYRAAVPYEKVHFEDSIKIIRAVYRRAKTNNKQNPATFTIRVFDLITGKTEISNSIVKRKLKSFANILITEKICIEIQNDKQINYTYVIEK